MIVEALPFEASLDVLVEADEPHLPEPERAADCVQARLVCSRSVTRAASSPLREVDDRHVLAGPRHEREAAEDRGRAERLVGLDLPHDLPVVRHREQHAAGAARLAGT